jgi:hypothetical protein
VVLPKVDAVFIEGALSYSHVRALTRVATRENKSDLVDRALTTTACNVEKYCHRLRLGEVQSGEREARRQHESRALHRAVEEGTLTPPAELAIVQQALEQLVADLPEDPSRDYFAARADALVCMARQVLGSSRDNSADASASNHQTTHQVVVHVDASALNGDGGESDYPLPTVERLCCFGEVLPILKCGDDVLNVSRNQRIVPTKLKRALAARDRPCQFPGCHHTRHLDAHHIKHWCDGGETKLDNLPLLCTQHHTLMHEGGFKLKPANGRFYFARPDGRPIEPAAPSSAEDEAAIV